MILNTKKTCMHSEKTAFADQVRPLMPKDGGNLEVFNGRVCKVKTWI